MPCPPGRFRTAYSGRGGGAVVSTCMLRETRGRCLPQASDTGLPNHSAGLRRAEGGLPPALVHRGIGAASVRACRGGCRGAEC